MKVGTTSAGVVLSAILMGPPVLVSTHQDPIKEPDLTDQTPIAGPLVEFGHPTMLTGSPNHIMIPNEITILKGETVTFRANGIGHGIAIYPVSKNTTREDIATQLCQAGTTCDATLARTIIDGDGRTIIEIGSGTSPINHEPGEVVSATFLINTTASGPPPTRVRVRFEEDGRYLVICTNRPHTVREWMFGFVNVTTPH